MKILNFGSLNIDHIYNVKDFPKPGETIDSTSYEIYLGGKGLNQSIALSRCGVEVYHAGAVGADGILLKEVLEKNGVDTRNIIQCEAKTGHALVQVNEAGENCIILYHGANQSIRKEDIDNVLKSFEEGDILLLQNEISNLSYLLQKAVERKMMIFFNPAPFTDQIKEVDLSCISYMILNESEAMSLSSKDDVDTAITKLKQTYSNVSFIVTLGQHGCYFFNHDKTIYQEPCNVSVVDTTGAGDTFIGYFIGCMVLGKSIEDCLKIATKAASITITEKGSSNTIPDMNKVISYNFQ